MPPLAGTELIAKQLVDTTFWLKPWLKLISLVPTFSIWLKCWLQQILSHGKPCSGMTKASEQKSHSICFISLICKNTKKFGIKTFEIDFVIEI